MLRWQKLRLAADLRIGDVQALEFPDARFDTVVCTLSLCTISDGRQAMAEVCPVLRPGGQLLLLEHVRSPRPIVRFIERLVEPVTMRIDCDHLLSDGSTIFAELGFTVRRVERAKQGILEWVVARKPEPAGAGSVPHGIRGGPRNERAQTRAGAGCSGLGCGSCQRRAGHGKSDGIRTVYRPLTFWAARQAIVGRKRVRGDRTAGRFVRDEVDHLVSDTWHRYDELREHLPNQPTLGSRMNIRLAA